MNVRRGLDDGRGEHENEIKIDLRQNTENYDRFRQVDSKQQIGCN